MNHLKIFSIFLIFISVLSKAQYAGAQPSEKIRLNQIGFYPSAPKVAIVVNTRAEEFYITKVGSTKKLYSGKLGGAVKSEFSDRQMRSADFSSFAQRGSFVLHIPGEGHSYSFEINDQVHDALAKGALKGFYFQRFSTALPGLYAGKWARPFSHPDTMVFVHPSAVSEGRPAGTILTSSKGWIDAGDYNKYIVNSGITMGTLLSAYEDNADYFTRQVLNIPESGNSVPDILDEVLWNLRWMFTMQDPMDGGVYHKCTNAAFDEMIMPELATKPRYVVQKSTAATLDFAAVMAQAARVFKKYSTQLPGLSDSCLIAAEKAWTWASSNPDKIYNQRALNNEFDPDITTGAYGDNSFLDEFQWAACELLITTNDTKYKSFVKSPNTKKMAVPSWSNVGLLGYYSVLRHKKVIQLPSGDIEMISKSVLQFADSISKTADSRSFKTVMGGSLKDYIWGSTSVAANQSILMMQAYQLTGDKRYLHFALSNLDYLLGRNATGYSFVTGYGDKTPMHPHHRPSIADNIVEPVPGLLVGGPNPGKQDGCKTYSSSAADEAYTDDECSYASNEIAINWNAPLVYLASAIEWSFVANK